MKQPVTVERAVCDICKNSDHHCYRACLECGKDVCFECVQAGLGVEYRYLAYASNEVMYCAECDNRLRASDAPPPLFSLLNGLKKQNDDEAVYWERCKSVRQSFEDRIKPLLEAKGIQ